MRVDAHPGLTTNDDKLRHSEASRRDSAATARSASDKTALAVARVRRTRDAARTWHNGEGFGRRSTVMRGFDERMRDGALAWADGEAVSTRRSVGD